MANEKNLKRFGKEKPKSTHEEAKKNGRKGGIASGEARRKSKEMKTVLEYLMEREINKENGEKGTTLEAILTAVVREAMDGNVRAVEFIRNTLGQEPEKTCVVKGSGVSIYVEDEEHRKMLEDL